MSKGILIGGMVLGLLMGCNNGIAELEKENSFYKSVVKIGQGFQDIFGIFGKAMGDELGFSAVKSDSKKSEVGEHFKKIEAGLTKTKNKLNELSGKISETKNADGSAIETVKGTIQSAIDVFEQLISALTKLASVTDDNSTEIGGTAHANASAPAKQDSVDAIIGGVRKIIEVAGKSGVNIDKGKAGQSVAQGGGTATATINANAAAGAGAGPKLAEEVAKADPWAMIDKIKDSKTNAAKLTASADNDAGTLATGANASDINGAKAATNADLVAAVALKAMIKEGKLSAASGNNEADAVKGAAVSAVNKVLGVLDEIIRRTVNHQLVKIKDAVKGIQYSETTGTNATEASTSTK